MASISKRKSGLKKILLESNQINSIRQHDESGLGLRRSFCHLSSCGTRWSDDCNVSLRRRSRTVKQLRTLRKAQHIHNRFVEGCYFPADCGRISNRLRRLYQSGAGEYFQAAADRFQADCGRISKRMRRSCQSGAGEHFQSAADRFLADDCGRSSYLLADISSSQLRNQLPSGLNFPAHCGERLEMRV